MSCVCERIADLERSFTLLVRCTNDINERLHTVETVVEENLPRPVSQFSSPVSTSPPAQDEPGGSQ